MLPAALLRAVAEPRHGAQVDERRVRVPAAVGLDQHQPLVGPLVAWTGPNTSTPRSRRHDRRRVVAVDVDPHGRGLARRSSHPRPGAERAVGETSSPAVLVPRRGHRAGPSTWVQGRGSAKSGRSTARTSAGFVVDALLIPFTFWQNEPHVSRSRRFADASTSPGIDRGRWSACRCGRTRRTSKLSPCADLVGDPLPVGRDCASGGVALRGVQGAAVRRPVRCWRAMVDAGLLVRKSGRGRRTPTTVR